MSYSGTVRCGYCHERGHNKRSCPDWKEKIEKWAASDDPYYQRRAESAKLRLKGRAKRCSWCSDTSHTIRKCDLHNARVDDLAHAWQTARKDIATRMNEYDFGVGSLIQYSQRLWDGGAYATVSYLAMVTDIRYAGITDRNLSSHPLFHAAKPLEVHVLTGDAAGRRCPGRLPRCIIDVGTAADDGGYQEQLYREKIEQAVLVSANGSDVPSDVLDWKAIRKQAYKELKK
jgi:hypothetical protein